MAPRHIVLALFTTLVWGLNFVAIRVGLDHYPPLLLTALRFAVAALPAAFLPRPAMAWSRMVLIGLVWFLGQFAFLFLGVALGMPAGLASLIMQLQAIFTIVIAAVVLGERPTGRQMAGCAVAMAGVGVIATTVGGDATLIGFVSVVAAAASWAWGNVLVRNSGRFDLVPLVSWLSLVVPLPALALSLVFEGPHAIVAALASPSFGGLASIFYLAVPTTLLGYAVWAVLLERYPAAMVVPFTLLVPVFAMAATALLFGEEVGPLRLAGAALILVGLAVLVLPRLPGLRRLRAR